MFQILIISLMELVTRTFPVGLNAVEFIRWSLALISSITGSLIFNILANPFSHPTASCSPALSHCKEFAFDV